MRTFVTRAVAAGLLVAVLAAPGWAGAARGPVRRTLTVQGFHTMTLRLSFQPGQAAVVDVQGDGDSPLVVLVLDAQGRRVALDRRNPDRLNVRWTATSGAAYQIKVVNRGGVPNRFALRTN
jgi:hypothetical protein